MADSGKPGVPPTLPTFSMSLSCPPSLRELSIKLVGALQNAILLALRMLDLLGGDLIAFSFQASNLTQLPQGFSKTKLEEIPGGASAMVLVMVISCLWDCCRQLLLPILSPLHPGATCVKQRRVLPKNSQKLRSSFPFDPSTRSLLISAFCLFHRPPEDSEAKAEKLEFGALGNP